MNLSQILINAGVTPGDLHPDCRFIAQDGIANKLIYFYNEQPILNIPLKAFCSKKNI